MKTLTLSINQTKAELDNVQGRIAQKQDEKRAANQRGGVDFDDENEMFGTGTDNAIVIDEEELALLRELKDLKRGYRDQYEKLKQVKVGINDAQGNVDSMKQQIVLDFERWYSEEFESAIPGDQGIQQTYMGTTVATQDEGAGDDEAETFLRAKKHIDTLHKAKKYEKAHPTGFKKK